MREDPALLRFAEVDQLIGNPAKARARLGWQPTAGFRGQITLMVDADLATVNRLHRAAVSAANGSIHRLSLSWRYRGADQRDSIWAFVPALRRVRQVSPANRSDGFLGSDMTQDDGAYFDGKVQDFTWKLVGEQDLLVLFDRRRSSSRRRWSACPAAAGAC